MSFTLLSAIFFKFPITRTPDNSNLFAISLEGSSYRESTVLKLSGCEHVNGVLFDFPDVIERAKK